MKKVFLEISKISQKKTCPRVFFLLKTRPWHRCFPVSFTKFLGTPSSQNTSERLLLNSVTNLSIIFTITAAVVISLVQLVIPVDTRLRFNVVCLQIFPTDYINSLVQVRNNIYVFLQAT